MQLLSRIFGALRQQERPLISECSAKLRFHTEAAPEQLLAVAHILWYRLLRLI